jgi:nucleotide-binding universal stress UspA family protein
MEPNAFDYYSLRGKNLLLATDGRPNSEKAMWTAMDLAKTLGSKLYVLLVVSPGGSEREKKALIKEGTKKLKDIVGLAADKGLEVTALLEGGAPYETIVLAAERLKAGAVVVGTSEKSGLDRVLIGSVSEQVVRNCPCTVIVVK